MAKEIRQAPQARPLQYSVADMVDRGHFRLNRASPIPSSDDVSVVVSGLIAGNQIKQTKKLYPRDQQVLLSYRGTNHIVVKNSILQRLTEDTLCKDALILHKTSPDNFRVFSTNSSIDKSIKPMRAFPGVADVFGFKSPAILDGNNVSDTWATLFYYKPKILILLPTNVTSSRGHRSSHNLPVRSLEIISVLAYFEDKLPRILLDEHVVQQIMSFCNFSVPLLVNVYLYDETKATFQDNLNLFDSFKNVEREIQDVSTCMRTLGLECMALFKASHSVVFLVVSEPDESLLIKYATFGSGQVKDGCPNRQCHSEEQLVQDATFPAGWCALRKQVLRANDPLDLANTCGYKEQIHTVGGCFVSNVMCFVVEDLSQDMSCLIELSGKSGGFSKEDERRAINFSTQVSTCLSTAVMLDFKHKAVRRNEITNRVINNVKAVTVHKVKHVMDIKVKVTKKFEKKLNDFQYIFQSNELSSTAGIVLLMFTDLGFLDRWRMRQVTIVRFILSVQQAYRENPYHNWHHGCYAVHCGYVFCKLPEIVKRKYLTDMEVLAFIVSCLCHDIDHHGVNSRIVETFSLNDTGKINPAQQLPQEAGLSQRQHLAVTFEIMAANECNILENLTDDEYREFLEMIQLCINATDLLQHLQIREKLFKTTENFDKNNHFHRKNLLRMLMTLCTFSESMKPWKSYLDTVVKVFIEFFAQGDDELRAGITPLPTMDRRRAYIPKFELKFLNEVYRPVLTALARIFPKLDSFIEKIDKFTDLWLIATKVFDDYAHIPDPLKILMLEDMKEDHLKNVVHPELSQHVKSIRSSSIHHTASATSNEMIRTTKDSFSEATLNPRGSSNWSIGSETSEDLSFTSHDGDQEKSRCCKKCKKSGCCKCKKKCCKQGCCKCCECCECSKERCKACLKCRCKRTALDDAVFLRNHHQELAFIEQQNEAYEKKRSLGSGDASTASTATGATAPSNPRSKSVVH